MNPNTAVFTTRDVLEGAPILFVSHDEDGSWQFHSGNSPKIDDAKLLSFQQIKDMDPSIEEVMHMSADQKAWRASRDHSWIFEWERGVT